VGDTNDTPSAFSHMMMTMMVMVEGVVVMVIKPAAIYTQIFWKRVFRWV
jgi:hypothetical protein